jgi:hypothetical protein
LYLFAVANPLVKIDRNGFQAEDVSNLERDLSRTEAAELTEFDPNWRQNMGFIKVHGNADIHGLLEGVHGEASIQGSASIADDVDTAYQRYLDMGVTEDDPMMGNFMRYNRERREHPRAIEQSQKRWKIAAIVGGLLLSGLVVAEVCFPAVAGEVTLGGSAAAGTAGAAAAETPGLNPGVPRPPAGSSGAPAEIPAGSGGASTPPPVYYHQINKGGLPDIVANQRLISTTAKEIAGGGDAVRASIGSFSGTLPVESPPVIEFTTDVIPRVNVGRGWGIWDLPAGEYLGIRVINIHYPPPW